MSREYTTEEIRKIFLHRVHLIVLEWEKQKLPERDKLDGVAFSIMAMLDGCAGNMPGFILAPCPHPSDKQFHQDEGTNWFPENHEVTVKGDIAGNLHEHME